jgi:hypothetical protein
VRTQHIHIPYHSYRTKFVTFVQHTLPLFPMCRIRHFLRRRHIQKNPAPVFRIMYVLPLGCLFWRGHHHPIVFPISLTLPLLCLWRQRERLDFRHRRVILLNEIPFFFRANTSSETLPAPPYYHSDFCRARFSGINFWFQGYFFSTCPLSCHHFALWERIPPSFSFGCYSFTP